MKWFAEIEGRKLFQSNKLRLINRSWGFELKNDSVSRQLAPAFLFVIGGFLLIISMFLGSWKLGLLSVILIGVPFTIHNWKMPISMSFNELQNQIKIGSKKVVTKSDEPELIVNHESRTSFVSPFEEGYQDHYYTFLLRLKNKTEVSLFKLKSRQQIDEQIQRLVAEFSKFSIWSN